MVVSGIPPILGLIYVLLAFPVIAGLWYKGKMTRPIVFLFLFISAGLGFLIFSPMVPYQIQQAITGGGPGPGSPLPIVIVLAAVFMVLTFVAGRIFCGQLCPIGAVQELIYTDPKQKTSTAQKRIIMVIRFLYFIVFLVAGLLFYDGHRLALKGYPLIQMAECILLLPCKQLPDRIVPQMLFEQAPADVSLAERLRRAVADPSRLLLGLPEGFMNDRVVPG